MNEEALKLGTSTLHARIRLMEYILHLSYNLSFKSWRTSATTRPIKEEANVFKINLKKELAYKLILLNKERVQQMMAIFQEDFLEILP